MFYVRIVSVRSNKSTMANVGRTLSALFGYLKFILLTPFFSSLFAISIKFLRLVGVLHVTFANKKMSAPAFNVLYVRVARHFMLLALNKPVSTWKSMKTMKMNRLLTMMCRIVHRRINIKNNHRKIRHDRRRRYDDERIAIIIHRSK